MCALLKAVKTDELGNTVAGSIVNMADVAGMEVFMVGKVCRCGMGLAAKAAAGPRHSKLPQVDDHDFWVGADAQRRPPGSSTIRCVNLKSADSAQAVNEPAINSGGEPGVRKELAAMRVT